MSNIKVPDFPVPDGVNAFYTTRQDGFSSAPYDSFNIALHVGDNKQNVLENRSCLPNANSIAWLQQIHSARCIEVNSHYFLPLETSKADASFSIQNEIVCAVMTADCLPILICDRQASCVAAVHAGWRGLAAGIIQNTISKMPVAAENLIVWVGPHISAKHFEVGEDVRQAFPSHLDAFTPSENANKYLCNMFAITTNILNNLQVSRIYGGDMCTYSNSADFFSHRRTCHQGQSSTGRMLCGIYLK